MSEILNYVYKKVAKIAWLIVYMVEMFLWTKRWNDQNLNEINFLLLNRKLTLYTIYGSNVLTFFCVFTIW